jgi:Leucine-rich repeat (LRR) protein
LNDLRLDEGSWIEGRILTSRGEPMSRDPETGDRLWIGLNGPARPRSGASFESSPVDDDGRFRLRAPAGRNFPYLLSPEVWQRTWRKEKYERGIEVEANQPLAVNFRILEQKSKRPPTPPRPARDPVKLPPPVAAEWDCAETIRDLGGWYRLDGDRHVVEINMVHNDETGARFDNRYTNSDEALRIAPAFPRLKRLYLHKGQATDESFACLAELKGLETLFVWDATEITNAGAKHLANLENLTSIHLGNSPVGDAALEALSKLPKLTRISMQQNTFTDTGLAHLAGMKQLRSLWIGMSKGVITDAGMAHLVGLENLGELDLQQSKVTDIGLEHLAELKNLQKLYLSNSPVTNDGLAALRKALPNLNVSR